MSMLSPRLQLKVSQKQILTPGLVQMVTVLQLNRLELKDMITQEIAENPVLEESLDGIEELTPEEMQAILETERTSEPSDQNLLDTLNGVGRARGGKRCRAFGDRGGPGCARFRRERFRVRRQCSGRNGSCAANVARRDRESGPKD